MTSLELIGLLKYFSLALENHFFLLYSGEEKKVNSLAYETNSILMFCHCINLFLFMRKLVFPQCPRFHQIRAPAIHESGTGETYNKNNV